MKTKDILIAHPQTSEQVSALKAFMEALKIKYEISSQESYNQDFVAKILESQQQAREGKVTRLNKEDLKNFLTL